MLLRGFCARGALFALFVLTLMSFTLGTAKAVAVPTATAVTFAPVGSAVVGQSVTVTATVTPNPGAGYTVTFYSSATEVPANVIGTAVTIAAGTASITTSYPAPGSPVVDANFSGDATNFLTSDSGATGYSVTKDNTTVTIAAAPNPAKVSNGTNSADNVLLTATVVVTAPGASTSTGDVSFFDTTTATPLGTSTVASQVATLSLPFGAATSVAGDNITATYLGDDNQFGSAPSAPVALHVNQDTTTTTLTTNNANTVFGQDVTFTANVTAANPSVNRPLIGDTVVFKDGAAVIGTGTVDVNGNATFETTSLDVVHSPHSITAVFAGDAGNATSTSTPALVQNVGKDATTTTLTASPNPTGINTPITLTATVAAVAPGTSIPTGNVSFYNGTVAVGNLIATQTLSGGVATITTSYTTTGSFPIIAVYSGDVNDSASTAPTVVEVIKPATVTTLTASPNPSIVGQPVTLTASVVGVPPGVTPTGNVQFFRNGSLIGTSALSGTGSAAAATP